MTPPRSPGPRFGAVVAVVLLTLVAGCADPDGDPGDAATGTTAPSATSPPTKPLPAAFEDIATRTTMTPAARNLLARAEPVLVDRSELGGLCTLDPELSVLGCHRPGQVAVLAVTDPRLSGMTETTTAHEMLHAAWEDLERDERRRVTALLGEAFGRVTTPEIVERIEAYRSRDPEVVDNELHSILGTEVVDVGPELEDYYRRWFENRAAVVMPASAARSTFLQLRAEVDELDRRREALRQQIEAGEVELTASAAAIDAAAAELEALRDAGRIREYNERVDPFNAMVESHNRSVVAHRALVDEHNGIVAIRNALAADYDELVEQVTTTAEAVSTA